ncbi:Loader and inhibitor of phage G40P [Alteribacillus persepolensis]|uniref:Loader and inhibitor of phage G40P n=1 Tax=Alteribacillus persepolensis TaxID=568899 RepID=A0A1G8IH75_9BACI|nr:hypothetical protein [Alteribacillus persepolensis]SDI18274.1 Loader and inhibitor of phage G40P [Alteribacillus persepolensis]
MKYEQAVDVLETIKEIYPKFEITKRKAEILIPALKKMDYDGVIKNLSSYAAEKPFPPTIAEIASYPKTRNEEWEKVKEFRKNGEKVNPEKKKKFRQYWNNLLEKVKADDET